MLHSSVGTPLQPTSLASTTRINIGTFDVDRLSIQVVYSDDAPAAVQIGSADVDVDGYTFYSADNGYVTGLKVAASTDGTLPDPLSATNYYVIRIDDGYFQVASSLANAEGGIPVALLDDGDGYTTFTPTTASGNVAKVQSSVDGVNWDDVTSQTVTISTSASNQVFDLGALSVKYVSVLYTPSAGQINLTVNTTSVRGF